MALYLKINFMVYKNCVQSFMLSSQSALFYCYAAVLYSYMRNPVGRLMFVAVICHLLSVYYTKY